MIKSSRPHLLFLDIEMPAVDGFEVVRTIGPDLMPMTVFVTAFSGYAIRAFEANALDYLLKPFTDERFASTFARVLRRLKEKDQCDFGLRVASMLSSATSRISYIDRIAIKASGCVQFLAVKQIDWIGADGIYVNVHSDGVAWLHRAALSELESQLDPRQFIRVHRTALVNVESILSLSRRSHGEFSLLLKDGSRVKVSRFYRSRLEERLMQTL